MKIDVELFAKKLKNSGLTYLDIDEEKFTDKVVELLVDNDFFNAIYDEMILQNENGKED